MCLERFAAIAKVWFPPEVSIGAMQPFVEITSFTMPFVKTDINCQTALESIAFRIFYVSEIL